jgi:ABC-type bacteriocin/lantibiotic exporter with double-glycine peptidase domain
MSVEPVFSKLIMDSIESGLKTGIDLNNLIYLISGWFIMSVCIMSGRYLYGYVLLTKNSDDWARSIIHDIREMTLLPTKYHISIQNGEKIKLIDRGAEAVWETGDIFLLEIVPYLLFSIILISIGLFIHTPLTLIALIFLPLSIWLTRYFGKIAHTQQHEANIYWDKLF